MEVSFSSHDAGAHAGRGMACLASLDREKGLLGAHPKVSSSGMRHRATVIVATVLGGSVAVWMVVGPKKALRVQAAREPATTIAAAPVAALTVHVGDLAYTVDADAGAGQPGGPCMTAVDCTRSSGELVGCLGTRTRRGDGSVGPGRCVQLARGAPGTRPCLVTKNAAEHPGAPSFDRDTWAFGAGGDNPPPTHGYYCDVRDGLVCDGDQSLACKARGTTGQPCKEVFDCVDEDFCAQGAGSITGTCQPRLVDGASCAAHQGDGPCKAGSFCAYKSFKCMAYLPDGASCANLIAMNRTSPCRDESYCEPTSERCKPRDPPGAACTNGANCAYGCSKGRCNPPSPALLQ